MQFAAIILATLSLVAAAPTVEKRGLVQSGTGDLTWYNTGMGSCGFTSTDSQLIVALDHGDMASGNVGANPNNNSYCNKKVAVTYGGKTVTATIVDTCEGCATGALDASPALFKEFAAEGAGRLHGMTWKLL